jgi:hypothetical protein
LEGDHAAWRRRLAIVHYDHPYVGKNVPEFHEQLLRAEASGILNFCRPGIEKLFAEFGSFIWFIWRDPDC